MKVDKNQYKCYSPVNFSARCPQVRDADWVCRVITHSLPHYSTTKQQPRIINFLKKNRSIIKYDETPKTLVDVYKIIVNTKLEPKYKNIERKLASICRTITELGTRRLATECVIGQKKLYDSLFLTEVYGLGNCVENAAIAELILKMNNIQNACCASLYKGLK